LQEGDRERSDLVELARQAIDKCVREGRTLKQQDCPELFRKVEGKAGAFVSLKKQGQLRGCIGTFEPTRSNLAEEIVHNAISSCTRDPRFEPVREDELDLLDVSVDVLGEPEPVPDESHLDPRKYGVIVRSGHRLGLLLPDLEGVDTVEEQLDIARRKAGIGPRDRVELFRFEVRRYH
jgi:AmmeMemoRadiSam system protein A